MCVLMFITMGFLGFSAEIISAAYRILGSVDRGGGGSVNGKRLIYIYGSDHTEF